MLPSASRLLLEDGALIIGVPDGVPEDGERARDENLRRNFFKNKKILFWRIVERIFV